MRGSPARQVAGVALVLALLAIPLWHLTAGSAEAPRPPEVSHTSGGEARRIVLVMESPTRARAAVSWPGSDGEQTVMLEGAPCELEIPVPGEGMDVVVRGEFEAGRLSALRVRAIEHGRVVADTSLWGTGLIEDVVTLPSGGGGH